MPSTTGNLAPPLAGWKSYDYFPGGHTYRNVHPDASGGPEGRPCVWADDSLWTIDTPERPNSILFFITYRYWQHEAPADLRDFTLQCRLRGENLELHGANVYFWAVTYGPAATRWHYVAEPIPVSHGEWGGLTSLVLRPDPSAWHRSFASVPEAANTLPQTLGVCFSYGFSFVGFSKKVTGRIALADFRLEGEVAPSWPFTASPGQRQHGWLTVSGKQLRQVPVVPSGAGEGAVFWLRDDFCVLPHQIPFAYLAFVRAAEVGHRDLRQAVLMLCQQKNGLELYGGKIAFFVEHAASETRWVLRLPMEYFGANPWIGTLVPAEELWLRLSGSMPLAKVLAGGEGEGGYDYCGLMVVGGRQAPTGAWGLVQFSLGPYMPSA